MPYPKYLGISSRELIANTSVDIGYPCMVKPVRTPRFKAEDEAEFKAHLAVVARLGLEVMVNEIITF